MGATWRGRVVHRAGPEPLQMLKVWMMATNRTRIVDTLDFFPQHVKMLHLSSHEMAIQAARELMFALRNPEPVAPFARLGYQQHEALARLAKIFKEIASPESSGEVTMTMLIPQVRPARKYSISPWEMIHLPR
jgi:hypothetical protein